MKTVEARTHVHFLFFLLFVFILLCPYTHTIRARLQKIPFCQSERKESRKKKLKRNSYWIVCVGNARNAMSINRDTMTQWCWHWNWQRAVLYDCSIHRNSGRVCHLCCRLSSSLPNRILTRWFHFCFRLPTFHHHAIAVRHSFCALI